MDTEKLNRMWNLVEQPRSTTATVSPLPTESAAVNSSEPPLLDEDDLVEQNKTTQSWWNSQQAKVVSVGGITLVGLVSVLGVLRGFDSGTPVATPTPSPTPTPQPLAGTPDEQKGYADGQTPETVGKYKTDAALANQRRALSDINAHPKPVVLKPNKTPPAPPVVTAAPAPVSSIPTEPMPIASVRSSVPSSVPLSAPVQVAAPTTVTPSKTSTQIEQESAQQLAALERMGGYGSSGEMVATDSGTDSQIAPTVEPADYRTTEAVDDRTPVRSAQVDNGVSAVSAPQDRAVEESAILNGQPQSLIQVGTTVKARLDTEIASDGSPQNSIVLMRLTEPMLDTNGQTALPAGTKLVGQASVSGTGIVQIQIRSAIVIDPTTGQQTETRLPNALIVKADSGQPLIASQQNQHRSHVNIGLAVLSGLGSLAASAAQSGSLSYNGSNGSFTSTQNGINPAAALAQGGLQSVSQQVNNQIAEQSTTTNTPPLWTMNAGKTVQIFVTQTFTLP